jgi:hypothetical protein
LTPSTIYTACLTLNFLEAILRSWTPPPIKDEAVESKSKDKFLQVVPDVHGFENAHSHDHNLKIIIDPHSADDHDNRQYNHPHLDAGARKPPPYNGFYFRRVGFFEILLDDSDVPDSENRIASLCKND